MEVANVRAMEVTSSANSTKRRKLNSGELQQSSSSNDQLAYQRRLVVNSPENSISVTSDASDLQIPASLYLSNQCVKDTSYRSLNTKAENFGTDIPNSVNGGFSRGKRSSSDICSEHSEIMESCKTKENPSPAAISSGAKMPSTAEIEEFFSVAEKYEQKQFANKYNYDIVKDVPLEGRYRWVRIKP